MRLAIVLAVTLGMVPAVAHATTSTYNFSCGGNNKTSVSFETLARVVIQVWLTKPGSLIPYNPATGIAGGQVTAPAGQYNPTPTTYWVQFSPSASSLLLNGYKCNFNGIVTQ